MSDAVTRPLIVAIIASVANIGKVYAYERWAADWGAFIALFKTTISGVPQIRGWEVSRKGRAESLETLGGGMAATDVRQIYVIRGYLGLSDKDNTEKTFNDLIDAIAAAFAAAQLGGHITHDYIQVEKIEPRLFGSILCHYAELTLTITED